MKEELPGPKDIEGAAQGLSKLWTQYRYTLIGKKQAGIIDD